MPLGFCQTRETIRDHLSGNLCRCTGYQAIIDAVEETMNKGREHDTSDGNGGEGLVGKRVTRPNVRRLIHGRGRYTDDISVPQMLHIAFVRSTYGHAKVKAIETSAAETAPWVVRVITGAQVAEICKPMLAIAQHRPGHKSAPQYALAVDHVCYQENQSLLLLLRVAPRRRTRPTW